jgi:hypothetical protein
MKNVTYHCNEIVTENNATDYQGGQNSMTASTGSGVKDSHFESDPTRIYNNL